MKPSDQETEIEIQTRQITARAYEDALILLRALEVMLEKADALGQGPEDERVRCLLDRHHQLAQSLMSVKILPDEKKSSEIEADSVSSSAKQTGIRRASKSNLSSHTISFTSPKDLYQSFYQVFGVQLSQTDAQTLFEFLQKQSQAEVTQPKILNSILQQEDISLAELYQALKEHKKWTVFRELSGVYASPRKLFDAVKERCGTELSKAQATALFHFFDNGTFDGQSLAEPADFQRLSRLLEQIRPHLSEQPQLLVERLK